MKPGRREIYLIWILHINFIHKCAAFTFSLMTLVIVRNHDKFASGVPPGAPAVVPLVALSAPRMLKCVFYSNQYLNSPFFFELIKN